MDLRKMKGVFKMRQMALLSKQMWHCLVVRSSSTRAGEKNFRMPKNSEERWWCWGRAFSSFNSNKARGSGQVALGLSCFKNVSMSTTAGGGEMPDGHDTTLMTDCQRSEAMSGLSITVGISKISFTKPPIFYLSAIELGLLDVPTWFQGHCIYPLSKLGHKYLFVIKILKIWIRIP